MGRPACHSRRNGNHRGQNRRFISVEPLNTKETNIINSYGEAMELTKGLKNVAAMIDNYHVAIENQTFDDVLQDPAGLKHLHIAYPKSICTSPIPQGARFPALEMTYHSTPLLPKT